jgi:hypothetical protein
LHGGATHDGHTLRPVAQVVRRTSWRRVGHRESDSGNRHILLVVLAAYVAAGVGLLVLAAHEHGVLRYVLGGVGVVGLGLPAFWILALLLFGLGWGFITATFREHPSTTQWLVWLVGAVLGGAVLGTSTYSGGPIALVSGPVLLVAVIGALKAQGFDQDYVNRRLIWFFAIAAAVSIPVGLTIFL